MNTTTTLNNWGNLLVALGASVTGVGIVVIVGWITGSMALVQIQPEFASMKFNTALCFVLTGFGIAIVKLNKSHTAIRCCGTTVAIIATLSLLQWITGINLHIDNLVIVDQFDDPTAPPGRMSIPTASCFLLSDFALVLLTFRHIKAYVLTIVAVLGGIVLALGLIGLIDYSLSIYTDFGWRQTTVMAVHTASCFLLIGSALIVLSMFTGDGNRLRFSAEIIPLATVLLMLCLSLSIALDNKNAAYLGVILETQLDNEIGQINNDINFAANALNRGVKRWEMQNGKLTQSAWQADAQLYVETLPYLKILAWVNHAAHPDWLVSDSNDNPSEDLKNILFQIPVFDRQGSSAYSVSTSKLGKVIVISSAINSGSDGFLLGVFDFSGLFNKLTVLNNNDPGWLNIRVGRDILFSNLDPDILLPDVYSVRRQLSIQNLDFVFEKGLFTDTTLGLGVLRSTVFIIGSLFTLFLLLALHAYHRSRAVLQVLNNEKERFRLVIEAAPGAMLLVNAQGTIEFLNSKAETLFGYRSGTLLGKNVDELVPVNLRAEHVNLRESYMQTPRFRSMAKDQELFGQHKSGHLIPLEIELCPIKTDQGTKALASIFDLSERTIQLKALKRSKEELDRAGCIAKIGAWDLDIVNQEVHWSAQTYRIHEVPDTVPLSLDFAFKFFSEGDREKISQAIDEATSKGTEWDLEVPLTTLLNNKIWVRTHGRVEYENGKATRLVGAIQDITEERTNILELERRNQELNNFAYVASHDLKSPLRGIDQLATWLSEDLADSISVQTQEHLRLMRSRIHRMENLLDDLLAYSRAGRTEVITECVDIVNFLQQIFEFCNIEQRFNLQIIGDKNDYLLFKTPLELILRNLINNAIKHHDKKQGNILVSIKFNNNWLEFSVADDGPGIPAEHNERVFAMFQTLQPRDKVEGSGMGLAIVRKVVETFGGTIELSTNQPRGALFRFSFPAKNNPR